MALRGCLVVIKRLWDRADEEWEHCCSDNGGNVETPTPRQAPFDVAANDGGNVAPRDEGKGVDAHVEAAFVLEEEVADCGAAEAEGNCGEEAVKGSEGEEGAVGARGTRGTGGGG